MKKFDATWKIFTVYMLVIVFMILANTAFGQIKVTQFNANYLRSYMEGPGKMQREFNLAH